MSCVCVMCVCLFSGSAPNSFLYKVGGQHLRVSHVGLEWLDIMVPKFTYNNKRNEQWSTTMKNNRVLMMPLCDRDLWIPSAANWN